MEEFTITVTIADRPYRLTIDRDEEEIIRKAEKLINEALRNYSDAYAYNDKQDLVAMVALQFTTNSLKLEDQINFFDKDMIEKLKIIDNLLQGSLNNKK